METVLGAVLVGCCVGLPVLAWALASLGLKKRRAQKGRQNEDSFP